MGAIVDIVGGWIGGEQQSQGEEDARKVSQKAAQEQLKLYREVYNQQRSDQLPWLQQGGQAANLLGQFYGFTPSAVPGAQSMVGVPASAGPAPQNPQSPQNPQNPQGQQGSLLDRIRAQIGGNALAGASGQTPTPATSPATPVATTQPVGTPTQTPEQMQQAAMQRFFTSPDYQFRLNEGNRNILGNAAATGGLQSGATLQALQGYGQNLASGEFGNYWNRLAGLAGVGQSAASNVGAAGGQFAGNSGQAIGQNAANRASSYVRNGQNWANTAGGIAGSIQSASNNIGNILLDMV